MEELIEGACASLPISTEFVSAIVGAVVGGGIAYLVQLRAIREARRQRAEERLEIQQAFGHSLLFKIIRIFSNICNIRGHIEDCFVRAERDGLGGEPWQFVLPLANLPDPISFSPEEMGLLLSMKNDQLFNDAIDLDVAHNSLLASFEAFNGLRQKLAERLPPDVVEGRVVAGNLDREQAKRLRPKMIEVNDVIVAIRDNCAADSEKARAVLERLNRTLREKLGLSYALCLIDGGAEQECT